MDQNRKEVYLEDVSHNTRTSPYSLYKINFTPEFEPVLYLHWHPEAELYYLKDGELDFVIEDISYHMKAGEAVFVPPNLLHTARSSASGNGTFWALVFSTDLVAAPDRLAAFQEYVRPVIQNPSAFCLHLTPCTGWQEELLTDLVRLFSQKEKRQDSQLLTVGLIQVMWQNLYNFHIKKVAGDHTDARLEEQLQDTLVFIQQHFQEDLSLETLAHTAHMSEGQLCRCFKRLTGNTPFTYLKRCRIRKSCAYLAESDKKISEICTLCGFNNISYFNREFLRMMKVTPSVYRAQCRKDNRYEVK